MPHTHGAHMTVRNPGVRAAITQVWIQVGQLDCCVVHSCGCKGPNVGCTDRPTSHVAP